MRICLAITSLHAGGAEGQLTGLALALRDRGHDVHVLTLWPGGPHVDRLRGAGVPVHSLATQARRSGVAGALQFLALVPAAWAYLRRVRPEVLHAWLPHAYLLLLPVAAVVDVKARISGRRGLRSGRRDGFVIGLAHRLSDACATGFTANAQEVADDVALVEGIARTRITLIGNAVEIPADSAHPEVHPPTIVVLANLTPHKGHADLLEALAQVDGPVVRVRLVGDGPLRASLEQTATTLGLSSRIEFLGHVDQPMQVLLQAQLLVHPSHTEGTPNAVLEAMAAGLPVVATDVGGVRALLPTEKQGLLVSPAAPQELASALSRALGDSDWRARAGALNREAAMQHSWSAVAAAYERCYAAASPN